MTLWSVRRKVVVVRVGSCSTTRSLSFQILTWSADPPPLSVLPVFVLTTRGVCTGSTDGRKRNERVRRQTGRPLHRLERASGGAQGRYFLLASCPYDVCLQLTAEEN